MIGPNRFVNRHCGRGWCGSRWNFRHSDASFSTIRALSNPFGNFGVKRFWNTWR